jgi:hypothetical protein
MNLKDQILEESVKQMQQAMDFEILADVMCRFGWHLVELDRYTDNYHAIDVREWVVANCSGEHRSHGASWLFKEQGDAVMFKLRWG